MIRYGLEASVPELFGYPAYMLREAFKDGLSPAEVQAGKFDPEADLEMCTHLHIYEWGAGGNRASFCALLEPKIVLLDEGRRVGEAIDVCDVRVPLDSEGRNHDRMDDSMFVYSVKLMDDPEFIEVKSVRVTPRLRVLDDCPVGRFLNASDFVSPRRLVKQTVFEDRELGVIGSDAVSACRLPSDVVKTTAEVVDRISDDRAPASVVGNLRKLDVVATLRAFKIVLCGEAVGLLVDPALNAVFEGVRVFIGPTEFRERAIKQGHSVTSP